LPLSVYSSPPAVAPYLASVLYTLPKQSNGASKVSCTYSSGTRSSSSIDSGWGEAGALDRQWCCWDTAQQHWRVQRKMYECQMTTQHLVGMA
jgi:hypothetical protein